MNNTNTGGPAFPGPYANEQGNIEVLWKQQGMTLRDYFAAKALQGICANQDNRAYKNPETFAVAAYTLADAMLVARSAT